MLQQVLSDPSFSKEMKRHVKEVVSMLLQNGINFSLLTNVSEISFNPPLPFEIQSAFKPITMFYLAGYTFESCTVDEQELTFEAGFGPQNVGAFVSIPLLSVLQIIIEETPILINLSVDTQAIIQKETLGIKKSMEALLSNPENEKLLKDNKNS
jgi:hypothetical protein